MAFLMILNNHFERDYLFVRKLTLHRINEWSFYNENFLISERAGSNFISLDIG